MTQVLVAAHLGRSQPTIAQMEREARAIGLPCSPAELATPAAYPEATGLSTHMTMTQAIARPCDNSQTKLAALGPTTSNAFHRRVRPANAPADAEVGASQLFLSPAAIHVDHAAQDAAAIPAAIAELYRRMSDAAMDRWYVADMQEIVAPSVAEALAGLVKIAYWLRMNATESARTGKPVWAAGGDQRQRTAAERAAWKAAHDARQSGDAIRLSALTHAYGMDRDSLLDVLRDVKAMAPARWQPPHGVAPAALAQAS
jgi:hypothetical protein